MADDQPLLACDGPEASANAAAILAFFRDVLAGPAGMSRARSYVAPGMLEHDPGPGEGPGLAGVIAKLRTLWSTFPDGAFAVVELVAAGDRVATRSEFRGTQALGDRAGLRVAVPFADFYRLRDGLIVEHAHVVDSAAFGRDAAE